jgi:chromate transporter
MEAEEPERVSLAAIFRAFFWIGLFSFGGGLIPWIQREVVTLRNWMTNEQFLAGLALSQVLPGVNSTNMAVFIGNHLRGALGATTAVLAVLAGPFILVVIAALTYQYVLGVPWVAAAAAGVAVAAIGMLLRTGLLAIQAIGFHVAPLLVTGAVFIAIGVLHLSLVAVVAVATPISILLAWPRGADA